VVPYPPNPLFTGRDAELARIAEWLNGGAGVAVVGPGGVGKTQLVAEYAHAARDQYPGGVFWLNMEQPEGIAGQVAALAGPEGLALPAAPARDFAGQVAAVRAAWTEPVARLLIFDNLEDPTVWKEWRPPRGGARVILTSRRRNWAATGGVRRLALPALPRPAGQELLLAPRAVARATTPAALLADPATAADADAVCEALGDLPLALALAGAYLEVTPTATLAGYRAALAAAPPVRPDPKPDDVLPAGHEAGILQAFALSYDLVEARKLDEILARARPGPLLQWVQRKPSAPDSAPHNAPARILLHPAALLAPAPIPRRLLARAAGLAPSNGAVPPQADQALSRLAALGLVASLDDDTVRVHRLLAAYVRRRAPGSAKDHTAIARALIAEVSAIADAGDPRPGLACLPHLRQVARGADARGDESAAWLHNQLGRVLRAQGDLAGARPAYERALAIDQAAYGPTHPEVATDLNNLGGLLRAQGRLAEARSCYERALAIYEQASGSTHPYTATCLSNLGLVLQDRGDLAGARPYAERALAIYEQALGPTHLTTATGLSNLGCLLQAQGEFGEAWSYLERAFTIAEQSLGPHHPTTQLFQANLAVLRDALPAGADLRAPPAQPGRLWEQWWHRVQRAARGGRA
jgi:tetratricopeptide (TPR) repeat protein